MTYLLIKFLVMGFLIRLGFKSLRLIIPTVLFLIVAYAVYTIVSASL